MLRSTDRIRVTHVGSLPRSDRLTRLMFDSQDGKDNRAELWPAIGAEVSAVVAMQKRVGIDTVSDGEAGKPGFSNYVRNRLDGLGGHSDGWRFHDLVEMGPAALPEPQREAAAHINMPACEGPLRYRDAEVRRDIENLRGAMAEAGADEAFLPAASPGILAGHITNRHYRGYEDYLQALADTMREEYEAIAGAGLIVQVDAPDLPCAEPRHSTLCPPEVMERYGLAGVIELHLEAIESATRNIPSEQFRLHLCWGNYPASHRYDIPLSDVLEPVLRKTHAGAVLFESANPRHEHEWELFERHEPPGDAILIPGVVDTLTSFVEHPRAVSQRIRRWAGVVDRQRLAVGTDCGFGTMLGLGFVPAPIVWEKLRSLSEGAALASEALWP